MGLFSRKPAVADARPKSRPSISSEAQARELRVRARRRLIGALALALAAVIVVPMLFDTTSEGPQESMIVVPMVVAPAVDDPLTQALDVGAPAGGVIIAEQDAADAPPPVQRPPLPPQTSRASPPPPSTTPRNRVSNDTASTATNTPDTPSNTPARAPSTPSTPPTQDRTDDGALALALLEGRQPSSASAPPSPNSFVLQVAAYLSQQDATARRDRLVRSGITNVRVETAQVNGRNTYRVRVGPFSTREAAQAAQARIRALGDYPDAYITRQ